MLIQVDWGATPIERGAARLVQPFSLLALLSCCLAAMLSFSLRPCSLAVVRSFGRSAVQPCCLPGLLSFNRAAVQLVSSAVERPDHVFVEFPRDEYPLLDVDATVDAFHRELDREGEGAARATGTPSVFAPVQGIRVALVGYPGRRRRQVDSGGGQGSALSSLVSRIARVRLPRVRPPVLECRKNGAAVRTPGSYEILQVEGHPKRSSLFAVAETQHASAVSIPPLARVQIIDELAGRSRIIHSRPCRSHACGSHACRSHACRS